MEYGFLKAEDLSKCKPEWFERQVMRCLAFAGWQDLRHVGRAWDGGADITGVFSGERRVIQVKANKGPSSTKAIRDVERASAIYGVRKGLAVALGGWTDTAKKLASKYGDELRLVSGLQLIAAMKRYPVFLPGSRTLYKFQEDAVNALFSSRERGHINSLITMATGLGKTVVAAEYIGKIISSDPNIKILVLAHSEDILKQSERSFWQHLPKSVSTHQLNGREVPHRNDGITFATFQTIKNQIAKANNEQLYDTVVVDECHHAAAPSYFTVLNNLNYNFLVGLTATPWRGDEKQLRDFFGDPIYSKSIIEAMNQGWLSEVDYRLLIDNIPWERLSELTGRKLSVKQLNAKFFVPQLEEAVTHKIWDHWGDIGKPRALVFCRTIKSAERIMRLINQAGFARAEVVSSRLAPGERRIDREIKLMRFNDGDIDILCGVDVFNEGIDVPDVNLLVFLRVTHSRRIFVQQLGRGLRWKPVKVVRVLDFVSDIRRIAALVHMEVEHELWQSQKPVEVSLPDKIIHFDNDKKASFFTEWLKDVAELEDASESSELVFPSVY